jgi:hypothetical protein
MEHNMNDETETKPSDVVAAAADKAIMTDKRGRTIVVRQLNALNYYLFLKAMTDIATNPAAMDFAAIAAAVVRIDTTDFAPPQKESDVRFLLQILDFDGIEAVAAGLKQLNKAKEASGIDTAKN